jgi:hypothetical protein
MVQNNIAMHCRCCISCAAGPLACGSVWMMELSRMGSCCRCGVLVTPQQLTLCSSAQTTTGHLMKSSHSCPILLQVKPQRGRLIGRSVIATGEPKETIFSASAGCCDKRSSLVRIGDCPHGIAACAGTVWQALWKPRLHHTCASNLAQNPRETMCHRCASPQLTMQASQHGCGCTRMVSG